MQMGQVVTSSYTIQRLNRGDDKGKSGFKGLTGNNGKARVVCDAEPTNNSLNTECINCNRGTWSDTIGAK